QMQNPWRACPPRDPPPTTMSARRARAGVPTYLQSLVTGHIGYDRAGHRVDQENAIKILHVAVGTHSRHFGDDRRRERHEPHGRRHPRADGVSIVAIGSGRRHDRPRGRRRDIRIVRVIAVVYLGIVLGDPRPPPRVDHTPPPPCP